MWQYAGKDARKAYLAATPTPNVWRLPAKLMVKDAIAQVFSRENERWRCVSGMCVCWEADVKASCTQAV